MIKAVFISFLLFLSAQSAFGSNIYLDTRIKAETEGNRLKVEVVVENKGDEAAYNLRPEIKAGGQKHMAEKTDQLGVKESYRGSADFDLSSLTTPGTYPLQVILYYSDAGKRSFTVLTGKTFSYKTKKPSLVFGRMPIATFWKKGEMKLTLKNIGNSEITVSAGLVVPEELLVEGRAQQIVLLSGEEKSISFKLKNLSALSGSGYRIFAVAEYDKDGIHRTSIIPSMVRIIKDKKASGFNLIPVIIIVLLALAAVFIAVRFFRKKKA